MASRDDSRTPDRDVVRLGIRQDEQLRILKNIEANIAKIKDKNRAKSDADFLERAMVNLERHADSYLRGVDNASKMSKFMADLINKRQQDEAKRLGGIVTIMNQFGVSADVAASLYEESARKQKETIDYVKKKAIELFNSLAQIANNWSAASNEYIKVSGMRSGDVYQNRSEFTDMIGDLNKSTGYLFNALDSYKNVLSMTQNITGDLGAIQEMSRPLLLASETMPGDLTSIAETFNRFYVRYGFSSKSMESVLDGIRKNTAGNAANPEAVQRAMSDLSTNIQMMTLGDEKRATDLMNQVTESVSYMESLGLESKDVIDLTDRFLSGTLSKDMLSLLSNGGLDVSTARDRVLSGDMKLTEFTEALLEGVYNVADPRIEVKKDKNGKEYAETIVNFDKSLESYGFSPEFFKNVWLTKSGYSMSESLQDFLGKNSSNPSMLDVSDDKYVDAATKASNYFSTAGDNLAKIQESIGVGFSDLSKLVGAIAAIMGVQGLSSMIGGLVKGGSSLLGGAGGLLGSLGGAGGLLGSLGGVAAAAAPWLLGGAAVAAIGYTVYKAYDHYNSLTGNAEAISNTIEGIGDTLKSENNSRLKTIIELEGQFTRESDLEKQKNLIVEAGLATREDLEDKTSEQLKSLIESYRDAAIQMDKVTDELIETANKYYTEKMNSEQKAFTDKLLKVTDAEDRSQILTLLDPESITDEKLKKKIQNYDGSDAAWNDIIYGGKDAWFDDHNLQDSSISTNSMQVVSNMLGWGMKFTSEDDVVKALQLSNDYLLATTQEAADDAWEAIEKSGLKDEVLEMKADQIDTVRERRGYAVGTNYVTKDQLAFIHEGEEITPKKYNFAASGAGILKEVIDNMRESTDRQSERYSQDAQELIEEIKAIKEFMRLWKSSQDIESMRNRGRSPIAGYNIAR